MAISLLSFALACDKAIERPDVEALDGLPAGKVALLEPRGNPELLLGLPVEEVEGRPVIGEARRPGCEVAVREIPSQWSNHFMQDLGRTAAFSAGWRQVGELQASYGKTLRVESQVENTVELQADLRGPCGAKVITSVLVGSGWREVQYAKEGSGGGSVNLHGGKLGAEGASWDRAGGRFAWTEPQAWAFGLGDGATTDADIHVEMPAQLEAGQAFTPQITVGRDLWLIVVYRDAEDKHGVVFPSAQLRAYRVAAGEGIELPTMVAWTLEGHERDYEELIVYGFGEEGDFKAFAPPAGALSPERADAYVRELERRLNDSNEIPRKRWSSTSFGFEISAKQENL